MEKDYKFTGYNKSLKESAKILRKNMTEQEKKLWYMYLKNYPVKFYRQRIIETYIVDFYCSKAKIVIEIDGNQHYTVEGKNYDEIRTEIINRYNIEVIRIKNHDIDKKFYDICRFIDNIITNKIKY